MTTIHTDHHISLHGITYTVVTDTGQRLGAYHQDHGGEVVTSTELPESDSGDIGPIEAITYFAHSAGIKGFKLSGEPREVTCADDLLNEIANRVEDLGGHSKVYVSDLCQWAVDLGMNPGNFVEAITELKDKEPMAA